MARVHSYKGKLLKEVNQLSLDKIKALADFAAYLREREEWEETAEILGDKETIKQIKRSRKAWAEGKKEEFISLEKLKATLGV